MTDLNPALLRFLFRAGLAANTGLEVHVAIPSAPSQRLALHYPEGAQRLRDELNTLWKVERPQVTATVHAAALNGDRSENGDYIYGKSG